MCGLPDDSCSALPAHISASKTASLLSRATLHCCYYIKPGTEQHGYKTGLWQRPMASCNSFHCASNHLWATLIRCAPVFRLAQLGVSPSWRRWTQDDKHTLNPVFTPDYYHWSFPGRCWLPRLQLQLYTPLNYPWPCNTDKALDFQFIQVATSIVRLHWRFNEIVMCNYIWVWALVQGREAWLALGGHIVGHFCLRFLTLTGSTFLKA